MDAKQYLRKIRYLDDQIHAKLDEVEELHSLAEKVTSTLSHAPGGSGKEHDKVGATVAKIAELTRGCNDTVREYLALKAEASALIEQLDNGRYVYILCQYYLNQKSWNEIAEGLGISTRWTTTQHGHALVEFGKVYDSHILQNSSY